MSQEADMKKSPPKAKYVKPGIKTEDLTVIAALCNGTSTGGRKATTGGGCETGNLKS